VRVGVGGARGCSAHTSSLERRSGVCDRPDGSGELVDLMKDHSDRRSMADDLAPPLLQLIPTGPVHRYPSRRS